MFTVIKNAAALVIRTSEPVGWLVHTTLIIPTQARHQGNNIVIRSREFRFTLNVRRKLAVDGLEPDSKNTASGVTSVDGGTLPADLMAGFVDLLRDDTDSLTMT